MDNVDSDVDFIMKRKNFVKDTNGWVRGFTFITIECGTWKIAHSIEGKINIMSDFVFEDIDGWIEYFDRI